MIHGLLSPSLRRQRGASAIALLILIGGALGLAAYASDAVRMTAGSAQLKRATDAAALAAAMARAQNPDASLQSLAERYVDLNLGMDQSELRRALRVTASAIEYQGDRGVRVTASYQPTALLAGNDSTEVTVASTAVARNKSLEVALTLPNTLVENAPNLEVLRRLGKKFARDLVASHENTWLSLVPYSQSVNVYDDQQPGRLRQWALNGALNPVELTTLFRTGYASLADARIPDRRARLLCLYRGLNRGQNYFWHQAPTGQFKIHYRHDLPDNGSPGAPPISWIGPNPDFGQATGVNDRRFMVADRGCPSAPLLPLTNDLAKIDARLDAMSTRFNTNYAIALGWAATTLAPAFRGGNGWALPDADLPKDFDTGSGDRVKAVVLLANSTDQRWFDTDAYNAETGQAIDGDTGNGEASAVTRRFADLCRSFRERNLKFYLIVTGNDEATDESGQVASASAFRRIAGAGLAVCAEKDGDLTYYSGRDFVVSEDAISERLQQIVEELRQKSNYASLVE